MSVAVAAYTATDGFATMQYPWLMVAVLPVLIVFGFLWAIKEFQEGYRVAQWDAFLDVDADEQTGT